ncbi:hypothetical protein AB5I41_15895 [Sphingomonas sp. MMS24-JH45]
MTAPLLRVPVGVRVARADDRARVAAFVRAHPRRDAVPCARMGRGGGDGLRAARGDADRRARRRQPRGRAPAHPCPLAAIGQALVSCGFAVDGGALGESRRWRRVRRCWRRNSAARAWNCAAGRRRRGGRWTTRATSASRAISPATTRPNCSPSRASSAPRCARRSPPT